jgi:hypothetical protein
MCEPDDGPLTRPVCFLRTLIERGARLLVGCTEIAMHFVQTCAIVGINSHCLSDTSHRQTASAFPFLLKRSLIAASTAGDWLRRMGMPGLITLLLFGAHMAMAAPNGPPTIDAETTCRASERELIKLFGDNTMVSYESCIRQEKEALAKMQKDWATYPAAAKTQCIQPKSYMPSYVEWLTCLEMQVVLNGLRAKEADNVTPKQKQR